MTPAQKRNLQRLLDPRHVAMIGGRDAEAAIRECERAGFAGSIWPVNRSRQTMGGHRCFADVDDLPAAPDAVFLAIPVEGAIDVVGKLQKRGAGGVVCYTAGFAEAGPAGEDAQTTLARVAGDMALIGPNCYGFINYLDNVALWPFSHAGSCPGFGAAIVTQSGMLASDLTMSRRSFPFTHVISAGNQAVLQLEDFIDVLCDRDEVRAIGVHIEGLKDIGRFSDVALRALDLGKPLVALKTGTSRVGARLTVSHTGSLSGSDDLYQALFDRLGVIRVTSPAQMLETLKFLSISGVPAGNRVIGFTCSGGGATILADHGETIGLTFPQPLPETANLLQEQLPDIATVSNPLDYTTPIWGIRERVEPVLRTACRDSYDAALIVQDFPPPELDEHLPLYLNDTESFIAAARSAALPAAVCSSMPENIDRRIRDDLVERGITPSQGIHEALNAIQASAWYGSRRASILSRRPAPVLPPSAGGEPNAVDEWTGKRMLKASGLPVPDGRLVDRAGAVAAAGELGYPLAVKMVDRALTHKTEAGAVRLHIDDAGALKQALQDMHWVVSAHDRRVVSDRFLLEPMIADAVAELMVGIRHDPQFGLAMTLASGGVLVELVADAQTLLLPASEADIGDALSRLKLSRLLNGFRGKPAADTKQVVKSIAGFADYVQSRRQEIAEVEINPLFILRNGVCAVDVLMHVWGDPEEQARSA